MTFRAKAAVMGFFALAVGGTYPWWRSAPGVGEGAGPMAKVVLGAETIPFSAPVWVAEQKGYFREHGVDVTIRSFDSGRTALFTMLEEGGLDLVTAAQTPVIAKSFGRRDYAIVAGLGYSDKDLKLLARKDRGIQSAADLKGKVVGITSGSSGHFFLSLFLAYHQLQLSDVSLRDLEATQLGKALTDGEVDAVATWEPHIYRAREALKEKAVLLPASHHYREDFYFVGRKDFITQHGEALRRFLRAIDKAQELIRKKPREAADIVERRLGIDRAVLDAIWGQFQFGLFLDQSILVALEDEARWAIEGKLTDARTAPNYLDFLHTESLAAVKPDAVTVAGIGR